MQRQLYLYCLRCGRYFVLFQYDESPGAEPGKMLPGARRHPDGTPNLSEMTAALLGVERLETFVAVHVQGACPSLIEAGRPPSVDPYRLALSTTPPPLTEYNAAQSHVIPNADRYDERYLIRAITRT